MDGLNDHLRQQAELAGAKLGGGSGGSGESGGSNSAIGGPAQGDISEMVKIEKVK